MLEANKLRYKLLYLMFLVDIFFISLISFKVEYRKVTLTPFRCNTILLRIDVMAKATPLSGAIIPKIFSNVFSIYSFFELTLPPESAWNPFIKIRGISWCVITTKTCPNTPRCCRVAVRVPAKTPSHLTA